VRCVEVEKPEAPFLFCGNMALSMRGKQHGRLSSRSVGTCLGLLAHAWRRPGLDPAKAPWQNVGGGVENPPFFELKVESIEPWRCPWPVALVAKCLHMSGRDVDKGARSGHRWFKGTSGCGVLKLICYRCTGMQVAVHRYIRYS
jgi:hypothetical protein